MSRLIVEVELPETLPPPSGAELPPCSRRYARSSLAMLAEALHGPDAAPLFESLTPVAPDLSWLDEPSDAAPAAG